MEELTAMNYPSRLFTVKDFSELNYGFGNELNLFVFSRILFCKKYIYSSVFYTVLTSTQQNPRKRMV